MKSSVARLRSDNARLQKHCDDRALELKSRRSRTCEMGKKLQDTEVGQLLHTHLDTTVFLLICHAPFLTGRVLRTDDQVYMMRRSTRGFVATRPLSDERLNRGITLYRPVEQARHGVAR